MKKIKTALIGLGRIGWQYHLPALSAHDGFEIIAVVDTIKERIDEAIEKYGVKAYENYIDLLDNEDIDLMVIASPTIFHKEQAIKAMKRGIDVFVEKPIAVNLEDTKQMIDVMHKTGCKMMLYQPHRITRETNALIDLLSQNLIGDIYMIKYAYSNYHRRCDWQAIKKYGGGLLRNYGAHFIDLLNYITDSKVKRIDCHMRTITSLSDAEDVIKITAENKDGIIYDVDINNATAISLNKWYIMGKTGTISMENHFL